MTAFRDESKGLAAEGSLMTTSAMAALSNLRGRCFNDKTLYGSCWYDSYLKFLRSKVNVDLASKQYNDFNSNWEKMKSNCQAPIDYTKDCTGKMTKAKLNKMSEDEKTKHCLKVKTEHFNKLVTTVFRMNAKNSLSDLDVLGTVFKGSPESNTLIGNFEVLHLAHCAQENWRSWLVVPGRRAQEDVESRIEISHKDAEGLSGSPTEITSISQTSAMHDHSEAIGMPAKSSIQSDLRETSPQTSKIDPSTITIPKKKRSIEEVGYNDGRPYKRYTYPLLYTRTY